MAKTKVYIDGQSGTTGLQIFNRISMRKDLELLRIDDDKRHDIEERRRFINAADIVFLCLPDESAREAVTLVENPNTCVIDASTAHRTVDSWIYGFPELSHEQREAIAASKRIANPGCHATGFISAVAPLVRAGVVAPGMPLTCFSLTGYSGGGKQMIALYEANERPDYLDAPGIYSLTLRHEHLAEMQKVCGLTQAPVFLPVWNNYYKGIATTVMLHREQLSGVSGAKDVHKVLSEHYEDQKLVGVMPFGSNGPVLYANEMAGTNKLQLVACGDDELISVTALFDNLGKGASGAAVQNMNIVLGIDEATGLEGALSVEAKRRVSHATGRSMPRILWWALMSKIRHRRR